MMGHLTSIDGLLSENKFDTPGCASGQGLCRHRFQVEKTIAGLEQGIKEKDVEIAGLKEQLASTNSSLQRLSEMYRDKSQLSDMQRMDPEHRLLRHRNEQRTAREWRAGQEGGVIGIGSVNKLNTDNLPKDYFTRIDITRTMEIPLAAKAKLATTHPAGSYRIDGDKLAITDPNLFWSVSKYLVVVVE
ncbi:MAG: hypothetical protein IPJ85_07360 [Flavobacteriales bacterium]|nr:hypothetical protein [Flavobacteriales bacterium]